MGTCQTSIVCSPCFARGCRRKGSVYMSTAGRGRWESDACVQCMVSAQYRHAPCLCGCAPRLTFLNLFACRRVRPFMRLAWIYNVYCIVFVYIPVTRIGLTTRGALHRMPLMEERLKPGEPPSGPPPQPFSHPGATRIAAAGIAPSPAPPRGRFTCRLTRGSSLCGTLADNLV